MEKSPDIIWEQNPFLTDWSVTSTVVMTMQQIVGSIVKNQASGGKWLISEAIVDTLGVYIYCSIDEVDEVLKVDLDHIVEDLDGLSEARQMRRNLEDMNMKIRENVNSKLDKYLEPILEVT